MSNTKTLPVAWTNEFSMNGVVTQKPTADTFNGVTKVTVILEQPKLRNETLAYRFKKYTIFVYGKKAQEKILAQSKQFLLKVVGKIGRQAEKGAKGTFYKNILIADTISIEEEIYNKDLI